MKSQKSTPLQPKWLCAAAVGALTVGVIVGASAQNNATDLPAPPHVSAATAPMDGPDGPPPGEDGPPGDEGRENGGPPPRGQRDGDDAAPPREQGPMGRGQGDGPDDMGPPDGFGPPEGGAPGGGPRGGGFGGGGGGQGGFRPGGPRGAKTDTADGAVAMIERAYRTAGDADSRGTLEGDALNLMGQARDYYGRSLEAYKAKSYEKASNFADISSHLAQAVLGLMSKAEPTGPAGWPAPPTKTVVTLNLDQDRAEIALDRAYRELGRPVQGKDASAQRWFETARQFYKTASADYGAKRYDAALSHARAADEVSKAARGLGDNEAG